MSDDRASFDDSIERLHALVHLQDIVRVEIQRHEYMDSGSAHTLRFLSSDGTLFDMTIHSSAAEFDLMRDIEVRAP